MPERDTVSWDEWYQQHLRACVAEWDRDRYSRALRGMARRATLFRSYRQTLREMVWRVAYWRTECRRERSRLAGAEWQIAALIEEIKFLVRRDPERELIKVHRQRDLLADALGKVIHLYHIEMSHEINGPLHEAIVEARAVRDRVWGP